MKKKIKKKLSLVDTSVLYESLQLEAIEGKLTGSLAYFERKVRRWFSKEFSTPLMDTYQIPWQTILLNYYEHAIDNISTNEVLDKAMFEYLPEFKKQAEEEDDKFAHSLIEEQKATIRKKALKDKRFRKKMEQAGEIIEGLEETADKLDKTRQSLMGKPKPQDKNLSFDEESFNDE